MALLGRPRLLQRNARPRAARTRLAGLRASSSKTSFKSVVEIRLNPVPYWPSSPSADFEDDPGRTKKTATCTIGACGTHSCPSPNTPSSFPASCPNTDSSRSRKYDRRQFTEPGDLDIISPVMQTHQKNNGGNERIRTYMLREYREPKDFVSFLYVSQVLQAEAIKSRRRASPPPASAHHGLALLAVE